jgi:hypothetical protein
MRPWGVAVRVTDFAAALVTTRGRHANERRQTPAATVHAGLLVTQV